MGSGTVLGFMSRSSPRQVTIVDLLLAAFLAEQACICT